MTHFDAKVKDNAAKATFPHIEAEPGYLPLEIKVHAKCDMYGPVQVELRKLDCIPRIHMATGQIKFMDKRRGQELQTTAGKFARRFLTDSDGNNLSDQSIQKFAELVKTYCDRYEVKFTSDANTIKDVYLNGPRSCMSNSDVMHDDKENNLRHPAEVYATPDFELAYAIDKLNDNKIVARCLVSTINKKRSVIYGLKSVMINELVKRDIDAEPTRLEPFKSHRVQKIEVWYGGNYLMPYVDGHAYLTGDGDYFVLKGDYSSYDYTCEHTSGTTSDEDGEYQTYCDHCDNGVHEDDSWGVELYCGDYLSVCEYCHDNHFVEDADSSTFHFANDVDCGDVVEVDGGYYHVDSDSVRYSERDEKWILTDEWDEDYEDFLDDDDDDDIAHKKCECSKCQDRVLESETINIFVASRAKKFEVESANVCTTCYLNKYGIANDSYVFSDLRIVDNETRELLGIYAGYNDLYYDLGNLKYGGIHESMTAISSRMSGLARYARMRRR